MTGSIRTKIGEVVFEYIPARYIYYDRASMTWNFHGKRKAGVMIHYPGKHKRFIPNDLVRQKNDSKPMTAQEKAKELLRTFKQHDWSDITGWTINKSYSKQLTSRVADEVITTLEKLCGDVSVTHYWHPLDYWKEVKSEIEKL